MKNRNLSSLYEGEKLPKGIRFDEDSKTFQVYLNERSKRIHRIREQKRVPDIKTLKEAVKVKDRWLVTLTGKIKEREAKGFTWGEIVERWEMYWKKYPTRTFNEDSLRDHVARARNWTEIWWNRHASELSIGDAREVIKDCFERGASLNVRKEVKGTINKIFKWALEERFIVGMDRSPARDIEILGPGESRPEEKRPEILNHGQITKLLRTAQIKQSPWEPIWFTAVHSGMRSQELKGLRKDRIELVPLKVAKTLDALPDGHPKKNYGFIRVELAFKKRENDYGPTKGHYWRQVPINSELYWFLRTYLPKAQFGKDKYGEFVFDPKLPYWMRGEQARVLRLFCEANGLQSIKFHTLRACFATQLLGLGVAEDKVMKMGGWKDVETMRIYVRLAGIMEHGATEGLRFVSATETFDPASPYNNVDYRKADDLDEDEDDEEGPEGDSQAVAHGAPLESIEGTNVFSLASFRKARS